MNKMRINSCVYLALLSSMMIRVIPQINCYAKASASSKSYRKVKRLRTVQLDVGDLSSQPNAALATLYAALKSNLKSRRFSVKWELPRNGDDMGMAQYDRRKHTLWYSAHGHSVDNSWGYSEHCLFTGVTDVILGRAANDQKSATVGTSTALFELLPKYGCKRQRLWRTYR